MIGHDTMPSPPTHGYDKAPWRDPFKSGYSSQEIQDYPHVVNQHREKQYTLHYLTPAEYYGDNPNELLRIRESKIEKAIILIREINMKERKGSEMAGTGS